ncbi:MAG: YeeE/YedE thiosulfate transporter family protein, partial [Azonexus sp.]
SMRRYLAGAVCMGFGGMLAGGCAVGAGVSGAAIFALTAWIALIGMWVGAGLTNALIDRPAPQEKSATPAMNVADSLAQP